MTDILHAPFIPLQVDELNPPPVEGIPRYQSMSYSAWMAVEICVLLGLMFSVIYKNRLYLSFRLREYFSPGQRFVFSKPTTPTNNFILTTTLLMGTCLCIGLIISGIANFYPEVLNIPSSATDESVEYGFWFSLRVAMMSLAFVVLKGLLYMVINWVFASSENNMRWINAYFFITAVLVFLLFPFALVELFVGFSQKMLVICLLILFIVYEITLFYRLVVNFKGNKYGFLLIFLYFCTVELLPALFLWKKAQ